MVLLNNLHGSRDRKIGQKDFLLPRPIVFSIPPKDHHSIDRIGLKVLPAFSSPMFLLSKLIIREKTFHPHHLHLLSLFHEHPLAIGLLRTKSPNVLADLHIAPGRYDKPDPHLLP